MGALEIAFFLSTANFAVVNYLADPIRAKYPNLDLWWLVYVSFITGFALSMLAGIDLFPAYIDNSAVSKVVTALVVGGGSNIIEMLFGSKEETHVFEFTEE